MLGPITIGALSRGGGAYNAKVLSYSPLAYWRLDETEGTTATDSSGNDYHGSYVSALVGAGSGPLGVAPLMAGTTASYVNVYSTGFRDAFPYTAGSVLGWYRPDQWVLIDDGTNRFIFKFTAASAAFITAWNDINFRYIYRHYNGTTITSQNIDDQTTPYSWVPFALTWSEAADQLKYYIEGAQVGATQTGLGAWGASLLTTTGARLGQNWDGYLRDIQIYDSVLTASQISDLSAWQGAPSSDYFACGDSRATNDNSWISMMGEIFTANESGIWHENPDRLNYAGEDVADIHTFLDSDLPGVSGNPVHCFVNAGANDLIAGTAETPFKTDLAGIIDALLGKWPSTKVWLTKPYREDVATPLTPATCATWIDEVVAGYGANVAVGNDETGWFATGIATYSDDGAHYNEAGHTEAVNQWATALGY